MPIDDLQDVEPGRQIADYPALFAYTSQVKPPEREIVGREDELDLLEASMARPELCNALLLADPGTGKSHPNDTLIPVDDDRIYTRIGDLVPGDVTFSETGAPITVTGVFPQGMKRTFRLTFADGSTLLCNDEHLFAARTRNDRKAKRDFRVVSVATMLAQGVLSSGEVDGAKTNWTVPVGEGLRRRRVSLPVDPWVMGALIGDGRMIEVDGVDQLQIQCKDFEIVRRVAERLGAQVEPLEDCKISYRLLGVSEAHMKALRSVLVDSAYRTIPRVYFSGSLEQRKNLVRGLFDADGIVTDDDRARLYFCTRSQPLADSVREMLTSVGVRCTLRLVERGQWVDRLVHVKADRFGKLDLVTAQRWRAVLDRNDRERIYHRRYDELGIVSIDDLGVETEQTCIQVDSPTHLYQVTEHHLVTHNTALVQGMSQRDRARIYLELDLAGMVAGVSNPDEMAHRLKSVMDEASAYWKATGTELVIFIDEFHQIVQLSAAAVEAMKPVLADSGTRGLRIIAATTLGEFHQHLSSNLPLVERLQRINLPEADRATTIRILAGMAQRYGVADKFRGDRVFQMIYDLTEQHMPASAQPRKSILMLDSMVGHHIAKGKPMDEHLLHEALLRQTGVNATFKVDADAIAENLSKAVFAQEIAVKALERRLQICVANLHDATRPMASFLFTGSTGVGKTEMTKQLGNLMIGQGRNSLIRFDMSEFVQDSSVNFFREELTRQVWNRPYSVILLDEIEKASKDVTRLLLQVLDDGRLTDQNHREVSFKNAYIVMTTNVGSEVFETIGNNAASSQAREDVLGLYEAPIMAALMANKSFPSELLGRIDQIVPFAPLNSETKEKIVKRKLMNLRQEVFDKHSVRIRIDDDVLIYLTQDKEKRSASAGGAREAVRRMNSDVTSAVASFINKHPHVKDVSVGVEGEMTSGNKNRLYSEAYIKVGETL